MSFGKTDADLEWPTFDNGNDLQVSYSSNGENERIFTEFKPATETHNIRNKKRKPKKKSRALRLISESDINRNNQSCFQDRKRCVVLSVLIACVIIIVAICIFLGVYFGVIVKSKASTDHTHSDSSIGVVTISTAKTPAPPSTPKLTTTPKTTLPPVTKPPQPSSTSSTSTSTTSSTSTSTSTTTTSTTTTTTTTPAPTEPPVQLFSGRQEDIDTVVETAKNCTEEIIFTTDRLTPKEKCSKYFEMLRCVYIISTRDLLHVPVDTLGKVVENNTQEVIPIWIDIDPLSCRGNDALNIENIATLPLTPAELCSSPDAVMYYSKRECLLVRLPDAIEKQTDENKCRVRWGVIGCVADAMSCQFEQIESVVNMHEQFVSKTLHTANQALCNDLYTSISQSSPCSMMLYRNMESIFTKCSRVIQRGSQLFVSEMACPLFEVFFACSYNHIPSITQYEQCEPKKNDLRSVTFDLVRTASKVNHALIAFIDVSSCIDTPTFSNNICESPAKLVSTVDTECYKKFSFVTQDTICKYLSEYIYQCGPAYLADVGLKCTASQIKDAMISETKLLYDKYKIDMASLASKDGCIQQLV